MIKLLEFWHHFEKVNQIKFFRNFILVSENRQTSHFCGHLGESNLSIKFLKIYVLWRCFLEKQKVQTLNFLLVKNIVKDFFRSENFIYKRRFFFELRAVVLAISFYWFLNRSPKLKADENSTKVPFSNTNFSNKILISEIFHKNVILPESLKILCPFTVKWRLFQFLAKFVKNLFHWLIFFTYTNIRYLHLLMCLLHAKDNKTVANSESGKFW